MTIIVTGATSFVGRAAADRLEERGHKVIRLRHSFDEEPDRLSDNADVWLHFAWAGAGSKGRSDPAVQQYNTEMTLAALKKAVSLNCVRFVFAGSQAEYGHAQDGSPKTEYGAASPVSEYGKAKLRVLNEAMRYLCEERKAGSSHADAETDVYTGAEGSGRSSCSDNVTDNSDDHDTACVSDAARSMQYIHMRIFSVYGPGDHAGSLVNTLIEGFGHGDTVALGNCTQSWNYMYIDDAADAIALLCESGEEGIYNVASDDTRRLRSYVEEIHEIMGGRGAAGFGMREDNAEGPADLSPDIRRITDLGFKTRISFDEGVHNCINAGRTV